MARRFASGALAVGASQAVRIGAQLVSVVVLARVLSPTEFGIVAMAAPVMAFITLFADLGLNQAAVQRPDLTHNQASWLFCISAAAGLGLALLAAAISPLVAIFYGDPRAGWVCAALATGLLVGGLGSQHIALLTRSMRFRALALVDIVAAVVVLVVTLVSAQLGASYWALVSGTLAGLFVRSVGAWVAMPWVPSMPRRDGQVRAMLSFGGGVTGFNFANYFSRNLDNLLIGKQWGAADLGLYDRAYKLLLFPLTQVLIPIGRVVLPTLARLQDDPAAYRRVFMQVVSQVLLITIPGIVVLVALADEVVVLLLGDGWSDVVPIFMWLGGAAIVQPLANPSGWLLLSQGRSREYAGQGVMFAIVATIAFVIALPHGVVAMAAAFSLSCCIRIPMMAFAAARTGPVVRSDMLHLIAYASGMILAALTGALAAHALLADAPVTEICAALVLAYAGALCLSLVFSWPRRSISRAASLAGSALRLRARLGARP